MMDNAFTTFQNEPPYVISGPLIPLSPASSVAFTAGNEGDLRNERYIVSLRTQGLVTSALLGSSAINVLF